MRRKLLKTQGQATVVSIVAGATIFAGAWFLVPLVYGEEYRNVLGYLAVLLLKNVVVSSYTIIRMALIGLGKMNVNSIAFAATTPFGLVLAWFMLREFGLIGVAWTQVLTALVTFVLLTALTTYNLRDERARLMVIQNVRLGLSTQTSESFAWHRERWLYKTN